MHLISSLNLLFLFVVSTCAQTPTANTSYGLINGAWLRNGAIFKKIPYAKQPTGRRRFQAPEPPSTWSSPLDGISYYGDLCPQFKNNYGGSEDCLYLNILTPQPVAGAKFPVVVWIHGGDFMNGFGQELNPDGIMANFVARDVVFVSFNYRLNSFGFFNAPNSEIPQNLGLEDQLMLLKFVQSEIVNFGGNPGMVTIVGDDAGAVSASLLTYSPKARGLFKNAILQSGNPWVSGGYMMRESPPAKDSSWMMAKNLSCISLSDWNAERYDGMLECLRSKSMMEIQQATPQNTSMEFVSPFHPVIGGEVIPKDPANSELILDSESAIIIGTSRDESTASDIAPELPIFDSVGSVLLKADGQFFSRKANEIVDHMFPNGTTAIGSMILGLVYLNNTYVTTGDYFGFSNATSLMVSDWYQNYGVVKYISATRKQNIPTYVYSFDYESGHWMSFISAIPHSMIKQFLFTPLSRNEELPDQYMKSFVGTLWSNFAKSGNPNFPQTIAEYGSRNWVMSWDAVSTFRPLQYYSLNSVGAMKESFHLQGYEAYDKVLPEVMRSQSRVGLLRAAPLAERQQSGGKVLAHATIFQLVVFVLCSM